MVVTQPIIRFARNTEESLLDGTDAQDRAGVDIDASIARFDEILIERIQQTYPDADVSCDDHRFSTYYADGFGDLRSNSDTAYECQLIAEALFNDGNAWIVTTE